ncbi:response regulator transcription factor [Streptomyces samsunensis]|uniref:response regulator transcription factor n=1 Tax=Streptomyces malaysiensis TaxID=92644 RepID=UPI0015823588|nr:response regulator transcription factor [Streptomyces samsunensis]NUH35274.1 response regulator transcription factor [Streptomyces samsunensis]
MARQAPRPVTETDEQEVRQLHAEGLSRNEIARRMNRSGRTISVIAQDLGLSFDRTATEEATRARQADLAERRTILAEALIEDAMRLTERMWQPSVVFNIGGKENTYTEQSVDEPPADAKRQLMAAAGAAIDRSLKLCPPITSTGEEDAKSMLGKIMGGLATVWNEQQAAGEGDGDAP